MKNINRWIMALATVSIVGGVLFAIATPQTASAATCNDKFLLFPSWCRGLETVEDKDTKYLTVKSPTSDEMSKFIWTIVLNIIEIGLVLVGYIAIFFILYGGFQYMISQGTPDGAIKGRTTILNAIIGLVISIASVAVVNFVVKGILATANPTPDVVLAGALNLIYMVSGAVAVFIIVLAGYSYVTAVGDPAKIAKAKNAIMYAIVGIVVILIAFAITQFVIVKMASA